MTLIFFTSSGYGMAIQSVARMVVFGDSMWQSVRFAGRAGNLFLPFAGQLNFSAGVCVECCHADVGFWKPATRLEHDLPDPADCPAFTPALVVLV
jgi:hypothetical protein